MTPLCLAAVLATPPAFVVEGELAPHEELTALARTAWTELEETWTQATASAAPTTASAVRLVRATALSANEGGLSAIGRVALRQNRPGVIDDALRLTLRHELAHQFLLAACGAASEDRLFHEAFAASTSGELLAWDRGEYLSTPEARRLLERAASLDTPSARRALARLLR